MEKLEVGIAILAFLSVAVGFVIGLSLKTDRDLFVRGLMDELAEAEVGLEYARLDLLQSKAELEMWKDYYNQTAASEIALREKLLGWDDVKFQETH